MEETMLTEVVTAFSGGLTDCMTTCIELVMTAVPIALTLVGVMVAIKTGVRFFKNLSH